jgi:hypothetical protein
MLLQLTSADGQDGREDDEALHDEEVDGMSDR